MAISAQDVKKLREMTGVGMMDCKKALEASDGDMDKAIDWLREKGLAAAQKKAGRVAAEGMAYADVIDGIGVVVEVNAETDFVGKNEKFVDFVKNLAAVVAKNNPVSLDALFELPYPGTDRTVQQQQQEMVLVIGENIQIRRFERYDTGVSVPYVHAGGKIGVLVNLDVEGISDEGALTTLGKDIAMQIAAMRPLYLDKSAVPDDVVNHEKEIRLAQINDDPKNASKPAEIKEKMIVGGLNKYFAEVCLLQQDYVKGEKTSVEKHVAETAKTLGGKITVAKFARFEKGEGIEKKEENFAEEIAKLTGGK